jgi:hypothetical protein
MLDVVHKKPINTMPVNNLVKYNKIKVDKSLTIINTRQALLCGK